MSTRPAQKHHQLGVVAIEVAMGILIFLMMIFYWIEVSYMGFVSSVVDYAVAESSRAARSSPATDYKKIFSNILNDSHSLWANFLDASDFTIQTRYFKSTNALDGCGTDIESCLDGETASDTSSGSCSRPARTSRSLAKS